MVATDGHRLSYAQRQGARSSSPSRSGCWCRARPSTSWRGCWRRRRAPIFQQVENHLVFSVGGRTLASKMIEGQFPAFEKVIAVTGDKMVAVSTASGLATAIRRVSLLSSERSRAVKLRLGAGSLDLAASSPDLGEAKESLPADYKGAAVEIGFNAQYLLDFLAVAGTSDVLAGAEGRARARACFRPRRRARRSARLPLRRHAHAAL